MWCVIGKPVNVAFSKQDLRLTVVSHAELIGLKIRIVRHTSYKKAIAKFPSSFNVTIFPKSYFKLSIVIPHVKDCNLDCSILKIVTQWYISPHSWTKSLIVLWTFYRKAIFIQWKLLWKCFLFCKKIVSVRKVGMN